MHACMQPFCSTRTHHAPCAGSYVLLVPKAMAAPGPACDGREHDWRRFARSTEEKINEQIRKERAEAETRARAAAWEAEKAEAHASKVRSATCI